MRVLACGEHGALVEVADLPEVLGLYATLRRDPVDGVVELVPAARTLLVRFDPAVTGFDRIAAELGRRPVGPADDHDRDEVTIEVRYDGEDLDEVAALTGLSAREVVERHVAGTYTSAFCGFAPGFAYLVGLDRDLWVPRRDSPRTRVPPGAVAIADEYAAVYPRESPGGWRIIGHSDAPVWDLERTPPTLLAPGTPVRFVEVTP
jgi:KipI family sensor histidine kinase inhibitor